MSLLVLRDVSKHFGAIQALTDMDLVVEPGEVVGLMGDNGAGKSTLVRIVAGNFRPSHGQIEMDGHEVHFSRPVDARNVGIEVVYQDLALSDNLTAAENVFLGRELTRGWGPFATLDKQTVQDLVARGDVKGIAVSPSNAAAMAVALQAAKDAGIPVLTWDSDLLPENKDLRVAYIGTHNYEIGVNLAKLAQEIKPEGGTICIQSGGAAAANHNERMQGIRDTLAGVTGTTSPGERLTGQNGWTEIDGCPLYTDDDFPRSIQQFEDIMTANPDLDAFIPTGGFPQFVPDANRAAVEPYKGKIADGSLALVVADTLPTQIEQMKEGFSAGQVGQRPFEMGYQTMMALQKMAEGGEPPADPTYTGLDICTPETADTCIAQ